MSMQGDPIAGTGGAIPATTDDDELLDGAVDEGDTEMPDGIDEAGGIATDGTGVVSDGDAR